MTVWCSLFGHNYSITSSYGNYAFCSRCGAPLTIKEPHILVPGERRWINGELMEMNEFNMLEKVNQDDRQILKETTGYHEAFKTTGYNQILTPNTRTTDGTNEEESL